MQASNDTRAAIVPFQANISFKLVVVDENSCSANLPKLTFYLHFGHLDEKGIACKVCHIVFEGVLVEYDGRLWIMTLLQSLIEP